MVFLVAGLAVFFIAHVFSAIRSREPSSDLREKIGYGTYMGLFSLVSIIGLGLIIYGYGAARPSPVLYSAPIWAKHLNLALMAIAMVVLVAAYVPTGYIKKTVKHPMVLAVKIWAVGHLLANGELNSVLLFTGFLGYGVISRIGAKRRGDTGPGPDVAANLVGDMLAVVIGLGVWAAIVFWLHPILFGQPALPIG